MSTHTDPPTQGTSRDHRETAFMVAAVLLWLVVAAGFVALDQRVSQAVRAGMDALDEAVSVETADVHYNPLLNVLSFRDVRVQAPNWGVETLEIGSLSISSPPLRGGPEECGSEGQALLWAGAVRARDLYLDGGGGHVVAIDEVAVRAPCLPVPPQNAWVNSVIGPMLMQASMEAVRVRGYGGRLPGVSGGMTVGALDVQGFTEGAITRMQARDVAVGKLHPMRQTFRAARVVLQEADIAPFLAELGPDSVWSAAFITAPSLRSFVLLDGGIESGDVVATSFDEARLSDTRFTDTVMTRARFTFRGLRATFSEAMTEGLSLGMPEWFLDGRGMDWILGYDWDLDTLQLRVDPMIFRVPDEGRLVVKLTFEDVVPLADQVGPLVLGQLAAFDVSHINVGFAATEGLVNRIMARASTDGSDLDAARQALVADIEAMRTVFEDPGPMQSVLDALVSFVHDPGVLTIDLSPQEPLSIMGLLNLALSDAKRFTEKVDMDVRNVPLAGR